MTRRRNKAARGHSGLAVYTQPIVPNAGVSPTTMRMFTKAIFFASLALFGGTRADSQAVSYGGIGDPSAAPGDPASSYALTGLDHVNYYSGGVNITIPIHSIGGRGTAADTIVIPIQRQWSVENVGGNYTPFSGLGQYMAGFYSSGHIDFVTVSGNANQCVTYENGNPVGYSQLGPYLSYIIWTRLDGTQTILTDDNSGGAPQNAQVQNCGDSYTPYDRGAVFHSHDGSNMKYVANSDVYDGGYLPGGTLFIADGTQYGFSQDNYVNSIKDRNGNQVTLSFSSTNSGGIYSVTDPVGRVSTINFTESLGSNNQDVISYPGAYGSTRNITVNYSLLGNNNALAPGYSLQSYASLFPELSGASSSTFNPYVISSIVLADGTSYTIQYDSYGEPARLTLPTGGVITYQYSGLGNNGDGVFSMSNGDCGIYRYPVLRQEYADGVNLSGTTNFAFHPGTAPNDQAQPNRPASQTIVDFRNPNTQILRSELHRFYGNPAPASPPSSDPTTFSAWWPGLEFHTETDTDDPTGSSPWQSLQIVDRSWMNSGCQNATCDSAASNNTHVNTMWTTYPNAAPSTGYVQTSTDYAYDQYNQLTDRWEHDWSGSIARHTSITYDQNTSYTQTVNLFGLTHEITTSDGSGNQKADTQYTYDDYGNSNSFIYNCPNIVGHDNQNYAGGNIRGNVTKVSQWLNSNNSWINSYQAYDIAGNPVISTDANGHTSSTSFSDNYSDGQNHNSYAQATSGTDAAGHGWSAQYDYSSGKQVAVSDLNGHFTYLEYADSLERLTKVARPDGGWTRINYLSPTFTQYCQDQNSQNDCGRQTQTVYDGLGRTIAERTIEDGSHFVQTGTAYDGMGRVSATYNPSRYTNGNPDGLGVATVYSYDGLGRTTQAQTADGATSTLSYSGPQTTATDQAHKAKVYTYDALGRLTTVLEDPGGFNQTTSYQYDTAGNLLQANVAGQTRSFTFDSLSRMIQAVNPESGTTSFQYDSAGNLTTKTDARNVTTWLGYDAINRLTNKNYSDGTPNVTFTYDGGGIQNSAGQLTQASNAYGSYNYTGFDSVGRVLGSSQSVYGAVNYSFNYSYNLAGDLLSEVYPSGRTIAKGYDGAGRETYVQGQANGQTTNYAFVGGYWPHGALQYAAYANGYGVYPTYLYNSRLQMNAAYAIVQGDPNRFVTNWSLDWGGSGNNGTLRSRVESFGNGVPASQLPGFAQTFSYDNLNRLTAFTDYGSSRNYSYDTWGNGWVSNTSGLPLQGNTPTSNLYNGANQMGGGRTYDAAGNQTNVNGDTLTYDAENRLIAATEPAALGGATEPYIYDALGQRTIRQYPGNWVSYVYDAFGRKAATYNYWTSLNQEFIYMNGQLLATENFNNNGSPCTTCYYVWDHLGSPRLVTDSSGNVVSRHDYLPFGEEIPGGWAGRSSQWGVNDGSRDKFTGQERDAETGLDYFNARYFSGALGRFTSPDPMNAGADLTDPQTWNGYSYVRNNPMANTDPTGADICPDGSYADACVVDTPPPDVPTDPCFYLNCSIGGGGGGGSERLVVEKQPVPRQPVMPPNNGTPAPNNGEPPSACLVANINAVNAVSNLNVNLSNVVGQPFIFNGGLDVNFSVPGASPSQLPAGRYASSVLTQILGIGHSLHVPGPGGADPSTYGVDPTTGNFTFTTHIDTAYSTWHTPIGAIIHYFVDVRDKGGHRGPC